MSLLVKEALQCLANQATHKALNAFIVCADPADVVSKIEHAETLPASAQGPLSGKLIAVKDNICTTDLPTTCASGILQAFTSPYDATVVQKLREAGGVVAGKTNLDEFGMGSHNVNSFFGRAQQVDRAGNAVSAGGSSGGSAVAVATQQCWAALGTDTGGSVRLPAAYTGIVGFKPSYGLVSRWGVVAYANSLDTVGVLARDTAAARRVYDAIRRHDARDPTSLPLRSRRRILEALAALPRHRRLRIGVPADYNIAELAPAVRGAWARALARLAQAGHAVRPVALPSTHHALSAYYVLAPAEASSNLARYDGVRFGSRAAGPDGAPDGALFSRTRGAGFGAEVQRRVLLGAYSLSAAAMDNYFIQAQRVRRLVQRDFDAVFAAPNPLLEPEEAAQRQSVATTTTIEGGDEDAAGVDVLVCPTAPSLPPNIAELEKQQSPVDAYMNDVFTVPASLAGLPAMSVPVRAEGEEHKAGIQVISQYGHDDVVFEVARMIEEGEEEAASWGC
ncbi:uncharacterized protein K452DRAFT_295625 [Aplosporella prunicola CBS 121167]|uniref:Glutamyl-tRNA(Gln) amidotransferase subunit A, mitochondrial n=1 Tax=Aplosporella prunicola CBS 121167 TaxID=1176127 RepID=A0A6A6BLU4_9PEZI|nr:uncharacterized protein K452DRAFT_295625 [Aplosporella prunicola CBS 121167]KAF2145072.1 hypothetical protein K452DRAFT_295625 [Aplosporella prunicola CBS 121167]